MKKQVREIRVIDIIVYFYVSLIIIVGIWLAFFITYKYIDKLETLPKVLIIVAASLLTCYFLKNLCIGAILYYKAYAPMNVREQCRYEPTCSTYTIICLRKYGLLIGLIKGIRRICRCKPPYGGYDYPGLFKNKTVKPETNDYGK